MKLGVFFRETLEGVSAILVQELDRAYSVIRATWNIEHTSSGAHGNVTATSLSVGTSTPNPLAKAHVYGERFVAVELETGRDDPNLRNWAINNGGEAEGMLSFQVSAFAGNDPIANANTKVRFDRDGNVELTENLSVDGVTTIGLVTQAGSYSAGDTTPSVANISHLVIANAGATTITNLDDGVEGQVVVLKFSDANTTIDRTNAYLAGGVNFVSSDRDTLTLMSLGGQWYEIARAVNA